MKLNETFLAVKLASRKLALMEEKLINEVLNAVADAAIRDKDIILGGPGSISACSLFSASYACMCIVYYLLGVDFPMEKRGEYLINSGFITWINLGRSKNAECQTCSK